MAGCQKWSRGRGGVRQFSLGVCARGYAPAAVWPPGAPSPFSSFWVCARYAPRSYLSPVWGGLPP